MTRYQLQSAFPGCRLEHFRLSRKSARCGHSNKHFHGSPEGVLIGLLTARLGLVAIDVTRPLPFTALPRPALTDLAKDLLRKREGEA
jgi:hypothetical protein